MSAKQRPYDGVLAALPLASACTLLIIRWLPIHFEYQPNDLGIVSLATLALYPMQQEMFWYAFALAAGALITWGLARGWQRPAGDFRGVVRVEALGASALLAVLWLPTWLGATWVVAVVAVCVWSATQRVGQLDGELDGELNGAAMDLLPVPERRSAGRILLWLGAAVAFALVLSPGIYARTYALVNGIEDARLMYDNFTYLGETGQHLAWTNAILNGGFQGRDFFCLYGPLYDLSIAGFFRVLGRSVATYDVHWSLSRLLGWISLFVLGGALVRRPVLMLALPFLLPWVKVRVGFALVGLLFLWLWLRAGRVRWCALAGIAGGTGLLYSQEYGAVFALLAAASFGLRREARAGLVFATGMAAVVAPLLIWFAANDALAPMLRDLVEYPRYLMAGYAKMIFPSLASSLPLSFSQLGSEASLQLRLSYAVPAVFLAGLLWALPVGALDFRRPWDSLRRITAGLTRDPVRLALVLIALFGLASFRVALGRSSLPRTLAVLPAAVLLLGYALDRLVDLWRAGSAARPLAQWRSAALVLFILMAGFLEAAHPLKLGWKTLGNTWQLATRGMQPGGSRHLARVTSWVQLHTEPDEPVLFLPDDAAYYYLTDRPNPIRFVMGHQIVTDAHRGEVLADLQAAPPRYVVWDHDAYRVDELPDEQVFGPALLGFLADHYRTETRIGGVEVLRYEGPEAE